MKLVGIFYKLRHKLPPPILKHIYTSYVYPHLLYDIQILLKLI